tara:strand:- start:377 stop:916 length:540 start_codon:yes stop_codon:yes gene_type:complete
MIFSYIEFTDLNKKIWKSKTIKNLISALTICYLFFFSYTIFEFAKINDVIIFILLICILTDIGGYSVGKVIGGKKLTKISPKKTISGAIGSFLFSLIPLTLSLDFFSRIYNFSLIEKILFCLSISLICQLGDLFISFFKRKANVKDTGKILPGHGGILDRIDGILFAVPFAFIIIKIFL